MKWSFPVNITAPSNSATRSVQFVIACSVTPAAAVSLHRADASARPWRIPEVHCYGSTDPTNLLEVRRLPAPPEWQVKATPKHESISVATALQDYAVHTIFANRLPSSGMWLRVVREMVSNVSKKPHASTFRVGWRKYFPSKCSHLYIRGRRKPKRLPEREILSSSLVKIR